ncbi:hypothetical protein V8E52_005771 [Russula decolorans]
MPRHLRPRKTRQNYTSLFQGEDEEENIPGPSRQEDDGDNDFAPPVPEEGSDDGDGIGDPASLEDGMGAEGDSSSESYLSIMRRSKKRSSAGLGKAKNIGTDRAKAKATHSLNSPAPATRRSTAPTATPTTSTRHVLPNPNIHHRHRPVPLFSGPTAAPALTPTSTPAVMLRVERLRHTPLLFAPNETLPTNAYASSPLLTSRVGKAWGTGIGVGPIWQIIEDLGWFREAEKLKSGPAPEQQVSEEAAVVEPTSEQEPVYDERRRRPRVYADVAPPDGWADPLCIEDGTAYMPIDGGGSADSDGHATPAPPVSCDFGPFGEQTQVNLETLGTQKLSQFLPESSAHVFNAGASVWGLDWCPIHPDDRPHCSYKYYLAVAPLPSRTHSPKIGIKVPRPSRSCIQLWSLGRSAGVGEFGDDKGEMHCEMVLCIDSGPAFELKWCPLPSHDPLSGPPPASPRKLGLLAGVFEDGTMSVYVVPYPPDLASTERSTPVYVRLAPFLRFELEEAAFCTLDWGNSELIAAGLSNGVIAVYNFGRALRSPSERKQPFPAFTTLPVGYYCVHQSAIRTLTWVRVPDRHGNGPTVIASGGYDGLQCLTDIRELGGHVFNRTRDVINTMAYSPYLSAIVTIDHENTIKSYSLSPSTLGRGHALLDPGGPVWIVSVSDYHPQLAVGSADGTCCTTNGLRGTRRGGYVPFLVYRVYQLDYSRTDKRFRMLDRLKPREMAERPEGGGGAWHPSVGVQRVAWHSGAGLAAGGLLASATGSGLCRVDFLEGRWFRDRVPYERVEAIRLEEDVMDVDVDEPEDNENPN